jgi:uncharacterized membrane protein
MLAGSTINTLGQDYIPASNSPESVSQMTIWHNLLALWLWRYLVTVFEGLSFFGVVSVAGLIKYYLPSYYLWATAFFVAMLITPKTAGTDKVRSSCQD